MSFWYFAGEPSHSTCTTERRTLASRSSAISKTRPQTSGVSDLSSHGQRAWSALRRSLESGLRVRSSQSGISLRGVLMAFLLLSLLFHNSDRLKLAGVDAQCPRAL